MWAAAEFWGEKSGAKRRQEWCVKRPPPLTHRANFPPRFRIFNEHHSQHWPTKKANICRGRVLIVSSPAFYHYFLSYGRKWSPLPFVSKGMSWYTYHQQYCWISSVFYRFNKGFSFKLNEAGWRPWRLIPLDILVLQG